MDSILTSIKKLLGIAEDYAHFDDDIKMHINTVFMVLNQLGVGPETCYSIRGKANTWDEFISTEDMRFESVKSYVYLKVKLLFDPPSSSAHMEAIKRMVDEFEWRLNIAAES